MLTVRGAFGALSYSGVRTTKLSAPALMDAANEPGVGFAASGDGGFILPGFLPAFDAAATFVKVLDLMARSSVRLSSVVAALPRNPVKPQPGPALALAPPSGLLGW